MPRMDKSGHLDTRSGNPGSTSCGKRPAAFTLVELLVVVAILALLAAILFPVFATVREKGRAASCLSNQKQIIMATMQYVQDNDQRFPIQFNGDGDYTVNDYANPVTSTSYNVIQCIFPYIKSWTAFQCPSMSADPVTVPSGNSANSYFFNGIIIGRSETVIPTPSTIIFSHEEGAYGNACSLRPIPTSGGYWGWLRTGYDQIHFTGANLTFCDGHAKWRSQDGIRATEFGINDPSVGVNNTSSAASPSPGLF